MVINRIEIPPLIPMWLPDWCSAACPSAGTQTWPHRRAKSGKRTIAGGQKKIGFMAWFMGGFRIWDMIDDCWGWLVIWFMLICDDLWWFAMICDDLHDWHWFALIWWCFICSCIHWHQSFLWLKETSCKVPPQLCLLVYDPDYIINHICSYHQP